MINVILIVGCISFVDLKDTIKKKVGHACVDFVTDGCEFNKYQLLHLVAPGVHRFLEPV